MHKLLAGLAALAALASCDAPDEELNYLLAPKKPSASAPSFSINDVSVSEGGQVATLTITKTGVARSSSVVRVRTVNATAVSPTDYTSFAQDVSFSKNTVSATVSVRLVDDETHESTETFRVVLSAGSNARIVDNTGVVTITDNDDETPITKMCPDHSVIPIADTCPDNPPEPDAPPPPTPDPAKDRVVIHSDDQSMYSTANWPGIYQTATPTSEVISRAIGGTTISSMQSMLSGTLTNSPPDVLVMFYGTNDLVSPTWVSAQDWVDKYAAMIQQTQDASVKTVAIVPLPRCNNETYNTRRAQIIPLMVSQFGYNLVRTDQDARLSNGCNTTYFQGDGIHLTSGVSNTGHSVLAGLAGTKIGAVLAGGAQPDATQSPAPPPAPAPTPAPPVTGWVVSPNTLTGETFVGGGFTITEGYSTGNPIPVSGAPDVVGAFRFICGAGQLSYDDPIVYPGTAGQGKSHLHQYYGNLLANGNSTYNSLRTTGGSTCNQFGDNSKALNRSAYWMPAMLDNRLSKVVKPDYVSIYYKRRPANDPKCTASNFQAEGNCTVLPNGLKFIFGYDMVTGKPPTGKAYYNCQGPGAVPGTYASIQALAGKCPPGAQLGAIIEAPSCWDGVHLDSPNHRDHVAYPSYGGWGYLKCPSTHPYVIATFQLGAWYTVGSGENPAVDWALSSDAMHPGLARGSTFHADFWMAWDEIAHKGSNGWEGPTGCVNRLLNCSAGDMGTGSRLNGAATPIYNGTAMWKNPNRLVNIPAVP